MIAYFKNNQNIIIIILILLIFFLYKINYQIENFIFNVVTDNTPKSFLDLDNYYNINFNVAGLKNTTSIYQNRFNFIPTTYADNKIRLDNDMNVYNTTYDEIKSNKCCLVKKILNNVGQFEYNYYKYENSDCDLNNFELDQNNQLMFEGINGWSNDKCSIENSNLGACKHYDFECMDFITADKCEEYNEKMPHDPQNRKITFEWQKNPCYSR
jgi:hypothetical protein